MAIWKFKEIRDLQSNEVMLVNFKQGGISEKHELAICNLETISQFV
jgi:hypothetical protein